MAQLASITIRLMLSDPFYGYLLSGLIKVPAPIHGVAIGIRDNQWVLFVDERWVEAESSGPLIIGALKHELLHLIFDHPAEICTVDHPELYHIAADLVVNQYLFIGRKTP